MAYDYFVNDIWDSGKIPSRIGERMVWGSDADALVDNALFAWDSTAVTPTLDFIGNRACFAFTNSGSTATDGSQFQVTAAHIRPMEAKEITLRWGYRGTTATQDASFGLAAIDTSQIASAATDYIKVEKLAASTSFTLSARKASGTAESFTLAGLTAVVDTWFDFCMRIKRSSTAGMGLVTVTAAVGGVPGGNLTTVFSESFATQLPDTVDLSPYGAWRAGSAANVSGYVPYFGWLYQG